MSLKDINFKSPRLAIYFNNDLFYNKSLNNISLGVVPQRDIIYFVSDLFLVVWRSIFSSWKPRITCMRIIVCTVLNLSL